MTSASPYVGYKFVLFAGLFGILLVIAYWVVFYYYQRYHIYWNFPSGKLAKLQLILWWNFNWAKLNQYKKISQVFSVSQLEWLYLYCWIQCWHSVVIYQTSKNYKKLQLIALLSRPIINLHKWMKHWMIQWWKLTEEKMTVNPYLSSKLY